MITTVFAIFISSSQWCYESTLWRSKMLLAEHWGALQPLSVGSGCSRHFWPFYPLINETFEYSLYNQTIHISPVCVSLYSHPAASSLQWFFCSWPCFFWAACSVFLEWILYDFWNVECCQREGCWLHPHTKLLRKAHKIDLTPGWGGLSPIPRLNLAY